MSYEWAAACADNLLSVSKSLQVIVDALVSKHNFKLKGTGPTSCHLGCDFNRDRSNDLYLSP